MARFEDIFPTFILKCAELHELLRLVAFALFIVGTMVFASHALSGRKLIFHLVRLLVLTSLLVMLPKWGNQMQALLHDSILTGLGTDPVNVQDQYNALLVVKRDSGTDRSWWDILGDLNSFTVEVMVSGVLWLVGQFASLLLFWAYLIQKFILFTGYALSPLMIGLMAIPALRSIGNRYLTHLVGVLLWPLGWAVASLITQGILDFMTDPSLKFIDPTATFYQLQSSLGVAVLAFWIVFSTVAAPLVIQKVFTYGTLAGGELIAGGFSSLSQTAASTVGAAVAGSHTGVPLAALGAAGTAAILSTLSTAAGHGSAGSIVSAGGGLPARTASGRSGDDLTGDRAVRELLTQGQTGRH